MVYHSMHNTKTPESKNMRLREIDPKPSRFDHELPPLVVRPSQARRLLGNCGNEKLYALLNNNEIESFSDGRARFISMASLLRYVDKQLASGLRPNEEKRFLPKRSRAPKANTAPRQDYKEKPGAPSEP
jgi:hypothetical protein